MQVKVDRSNSKLFASLAAAALLLVPQSAVGDEPNADVATDKRAGVGEESQAIRAGQVLAPKAFRAAVARVLPSVVTIESFGGVTSGKRIRGISKPGDGPTTGVIISSDGYIITSTFNFIRRPPVITVILHDGTRRVAKLLGRDETRKVCLLKIDAESDLPVPTFLPRSEVKVGQWAISVGVGYGGSDPAISAGIISAKNRISGRAIQTDANISPANYGGPLVDIEGRVIGICVPLNPKSSSAGSGVEWYDSGIGFAIPLADADKILTAMKAGQTIRPASLGVQVKPAGAQGGGAEVTKVQAGSAAAKAGLKPGDRILSIGGEKILDVAHLRSVIGRHIAGERIKVVFKRGEMEQEIEATLGVPVAPKKPAVRPKKPTPKKPMPEL